jgi:hypothetical protein
MTERKSASLAKSEQKSGKLPPTDTIIALVADVINPTFAIERTMVMPFNRDLLENVGEHSFALGLLAGTLAEEIDPSLDTGKITEYALAHDVIEIYAGDVTVWDTKAAINQKTHDEKAATERLLAGSSLASRIARKYQEYEAQDTPEKRFVYALDKIYPHMMILIGDHHPVKPTWAEYKRTEDIAREKIRCFPALIPLFDDLCSRFQQKPHFFSTSIQPEI